MGFSVPNPGTAAAEERGWDGAGLSCTRPPSVSVFRFRLFFGGMTVGGREGPSLMERMGGDGNGDGDGGEEEHMEMCEFVLCWLMESRNGGMAGSLVFQKAHVDKEALVLGPLGARREVVVLGRREHGRGVRANSMTWNAGGESLHVCSPGLRKAKATHEFYVVDERIFGVVLIGTRCRLLCFSLPTVTLPTLDGRNTCQHLELHHRRPHTPSEALNTHRVYPLDFLNNGTESIGRCR